MGLIVGMLTLAMLAAVPLADVKLAIVTLMIREAGYCFYNIKAQTCDTS